MSSSNNDNAAGDEVVGDGEVFQRLGAGADEVRELTEYASAGLVVQSLPRNLHLPLEDEPHLGFWRRAAVEAEAIGAWAVLRRHLVQLAFPIRAGTRESDEYKDVTLRGVDPASIASATGLELVSPQTIEIRLHASPAGTVPVLLAGDRSDFRALLQALVYRNEPAEISPTQGAAMVAGYNNWSRIGELRRQWEETPEPARQCATWPEELRRRMPEKSTYQDRFLILSSGPYSAVPAEELGLEEEDWLRLSLTIRTEHECAHYFTKRVFGSMHNHLLDEIIADLTGLLAATGRFEASWFLRFLGLAGSASPERPGRMALYRGTPPLSDGAFSVLARVVEAAAHNLERFCAERPGLGDTAGRRALLIAALSRLRLDQLAGEDLPARLTTALELVRTTLATDTP